MDRFDCQFLMALATFVHIKTFVSTSRSGDFEQALRLVQSMGPVDRASFLEAIGGLAGR